MQKSRQGENRYARACPKTAAANNSILPLLELQKAGYKVTAIDLPAGGDNAPETGGLAADTECIKTLMEGAAIESENIIPVFHSYSGVPGSEAAAEVNQATAKKIQRMIYLAAFVLPAGQGLTSRFGGRLAPWALLSDDGKFVTVPEPIPLFYHDAKPEVAAEAAKHVVRYSKSAFDEHTKHYGWQLFPTTFIYCTDDRAVPMEYFKSVRRNVRR